MKKGLDIKKTLTISLAFAWISVFSSVYDAVMPLILTAAEADGGLALNHTMKGLVMAADNILGVFLLPLFGWLSDRTKGKYGKRTPYILIGSAFSVIFWIIAGLSLRFNISVLFFIALAFTLAVNAAYRPAGLSLLPDLTPIAYRRKANAITQIMSIAATIIGILLVTLLTKFGYDIVFYAESGVTLILLAVFVLTVREKRWETRLKLTDDGNAEEEAFADYKVNRRYLKRNRTLLLLSVFFFYMAYNGLVSSLSNYAIEVLNLDKSRFTVPQLLCLLAASLAAVPAARLSKRFRRKNLLIIGMAVMVSAFLIAWFQRGLSAAMIFSFVIAGIGYSVVLVNLYPYMMELSDPEKLGKNTGIFNNAMMVAMVITPILSGWLSDLYTLRSLFPYCMSAIVVSTVFLFFIKEKAKPES